MDTRPGLKSYDNWKLSTDNECKCEACYNYHHFDHEMQYAAVGSEPDAKIQRMVHKSFLEWIAKCPCNAHIKRVHHKGNGRPKGLWAGTLTMSPTDPYNEEDMVQAIRKLFKQATCPVEKYAWYVERTENDIPHIHFIYRTPDGGRIHAKVFKRVWRLWNEDIKLGAGHKGGYHRLVSDEDAYLKYIAKDNGRHDSNWTIE